MSLIMYKCVKSLVVISYRKWLSNYKCQSNDDEVCLSMKQLSAVGLMEISNNSSFINLPARSRPLSDCFSSQHWRDNCINWPQIEGSSLGTMRSSRLDFGMQKVDDDMMRFDCVTRPTLIINCCCWQTEQQTGHVHSLKTHVTREPCTALLG